MGRIRERVTARQLSPIGGRILLWRGVFGFPEGTVWVVESDEAARGYARPTFWLV